MNRCKGACLCDGLPLPSPAFTTADGYGLESNTVCLINVYFITSHLQESTHTYTHAHKQECTHIVHRDKCRQCAEAQMAQSQWRCRAAFDGCEWLISGLTGSDRVTSGGAWQPQAHARAFRQETRWSWNLLDAQQLHSRPHRSPIHSGYLQPLELDRFCYWLQLSIAKWFTVQ